MNAEYIDDCGGIKRFTIGLEMRHDGSIGPPYTSELSERPCASAPVFKIKLVLDRLDEKRNVAVYRLDAPIR